MFGAMEFEKFEGLTKMPQKAASAFGALDNLIGAKYVPLIYVGKKIVRGTNHYFIAEQTLTTADADKAIVSLAINEFNGKFTVIPDSIQRINF